MAWRVIPVQNVLRGHARPFVAGQEQCTCLRALDLAAGHMRHSSSAATEEPSSSWVPSWVRDRLPGFAGGDRDAAQLASLDMKTYATHLKRARQMGALTGFASGTTKAGDASAQGSLRMQESVIEAMTPEEMSDLSRFGPNERRRVAAGVGCTLAQVDDCIARYRWVKHMATRMAELKQAGKPTPKTMEEVEQQLGTWRDFKEGTADMETQAPPGSILVPADALEPKSKQPCPLASKSVSRNTKCSLTNRRFKACCGRG